MSAPLHGGPDALGVPEHDFSTNANACGPCPLALQALAQADRARYPDPAYSALTAALAAFHGVAPERIVLAASASEFIHRISALAAHCGLRRAFLPAHGYGDYARAAGLWGLEPCSAQGGDDGWAGLHWACEPASPLGGVDPAIDGWGAAGAAWRVLDRAYAPLCLAGAPRRLQGRAWSLYSPNKALGLTGVRAAYAIAPPQALEEGVAQRLRALAPSWPVGADGVALLHSWVQPETQAWLGASLPVLRAWKAQQEALCADFGWQVVPGSLANFFTARLPHGAQMAPLLQALRAAGVKLRDCASFGLPGHVRLGVLAPASQEALGQALRRYHRA
ncbi:histidinol-phosphate aminotransferase [Melaminivora alkalimesophila]|uniref:histidinol-phosphate transaminase n=2 Tax=Melaminivora alkalimesophila TaxID=1165852 RepID=A0A317RBN0_9BURK|nr:aminotransferase class I/II-fold pyridoxal phosphate-dependent enzyme [Melaminivora alkalimesophila]PWW46261.1 histidinol-phosphate aminotransferase [Melaminivora alkalimesophila]